MSDSKGKRKAKEVEDVPPKTLSRRASFWTRKKTPIPDPLAPSKASPHSNNLYMPLPSVQPGSPFFMNLDTPRSAASNHQSANTSHTRGLSRRHSERLAKGRSALPEQSPSTSSLVLPKARRPTRRPATADPLNSSHVVGSLFTESARFTSSPLHQLFTTTNLHLVVGTRIAPAAAPLRNGVLRWNDERRGNVTVEYRFCMLPVVQEDVRPSREIVSSGVCRWLVEAGSKALLYPSVIDYGSARDMRKSRLSLLTVP
ncbi:hypothetical protein F5146DRAFT_495025 [Armillaria mellea]|nr:hypothetical protein F5146DRAFT_495025 [Armillaria mellea]